MRGPVDVHRASHVFIVCTPTLLCAYLLSAGKDWWLWVAPNEKRYTVTFGRCFEFYLSSSVIGAEMVKCTYNNSLFRVFRRTLCKGSVYVSV